MTRAQTKRKLGRKPYLYDPTLVWSPKCAACMMQTINNFFAECVALSLLSRMRCQHMLSTGPTDTDTDTGTGTVPVQLALLTRWRDDMHRSSL